MSGENIVINSVDFTKAQQKLENHFISDAVKDFIILRNQDNKSIKVRKNLARCYRILGEYEKALECWEEVLVLDNQDKDALEGVDHLHSPAFQFWLKRLYKAMEEVERTNYAEAQILLGALLEEQGEDISLYKLLGLTYYANGEIDTAGKVWQQGLALDKNNNDLSNYLTRLSADINNKPAEPEEVKFYGKNFFIEIVNNIKKRCEHYQIKKIIGVSLAGISLLFLYHFNDGFSSNTETVANMGEKKPVNINYVAESALPGANLINENEIVAKDSEDSADAENEAATGLVIEDVTPYNPELEWEFYGIGYNAYLKQDYEKTIQNLALVVKMHSLNYVNREALYYLARTYYLTGCLAEAEQYYKNYLIDFPQSNYYDDSLFYLGCISQKQNDLSKARQYLMMLNEYDPNSSYKETNIYNEVMH